MTPVQSQLLYAFNDNFISRQPYLGTHTLVSKTGCTEETPAHDRFAHKQGARRMSVSTGDVFPDLVTTCFFETPCTVDVDVFEKVGTKTWMSTACCLAQTEWSEHPAVQEFHSVLFARDEAQALAALEKWKSLPEWPALWTFNGGLTYCSSSLFEDACLKWPRLALCMMDAGLCAAASEAAGCVALNRACFGWKDIDERVQLVKRLLRDGVDVNGLGPKNQNVQGRTALAAVLNGYGMERSRPILEVLLTTPGIQLQIQKWMWDERVGTLEPADKYASDENGKWAIPRLREALEAARGVLCAGGGAGGSSSSSDVCAGAGGSSGVDSSCGAGASTSSPWDVTSLMKQQGVEESVPWVDFVRVLDLFVQK
jgi:hypothetical protein